MVEAGEWPEPALLEQILEAGDSAVEPLLSILHTRPRGWPEEAPLVHAIGLLTMLRPPAALPPLIELARDRTVDLAEEAGDALASYGQQGLEALIDLIRDPCIIGYQRATLIDCAKNAVGDDFLMRSLLAGTLRLVFAQVAAHALEQRVEENQLKIAELEAELSETEKELEQAERKVQEIEQLGSGPGEEDASARLEPRASLAEGSSVSEDDEEEFLDEYEDDEVDDDEEYNECLDHRPSDALSYLVLDLCDLADPLARDMIQEAFDQGLIEPEIVDAEAVDRLYASGGNELGFETTWLEDYRESYDEELRYREQMRSLPPIRFPSRTSYPSFEHREYQPPPAPVPPVEPIRNTAPKIGRNDPCWCGSGKKYKKCHLGKDAPA